MPGTPGSGGDRVVVGGRHVVGKVAVGVGVGVGVGLGVGVGVGVCDAVGAPSTVTVPSMLGCASQKKRYMPGVVVRARLAAAGRNVAAPTDRRIADGRSPSATL